MIDDSLDAVLSALGDPRRVRPARPPLGSDSRNPFIAYFLAGKQALLEALVLAEAESGGCSREQRDAAVAELGAAIEFVIGGEVDAFGKVCQPIAGGNGRRAAAANAGPNEFAG
jgi:hypothetical protein